MTRAMEGQTFALILPQPTSTPGKLSFNSGVKQVNDGQLLRGAEPWGHGSYHSHKQNIDAHSSCRSVGSCSEFGLCISPAAAGLSRARLDPPAAPAAPAGQECSLQPRDWAAPIHLPRACFGGCFCLSSSPICICCFAISSQKRLLSNSSRLQELAGCSPPPDTAGTLLLRGMSHFCTLSFPFLLFPVHRDICETQKDESSPINCQASADTSCHTTDRTEFVKIHLNNEELRILLNSKRSIRSAGEVFWKSPSVGISPWFPSVETITFIMIKTCLPERGLTEWRIWKQIWKCLASPPYFVLGVNRPCCFNCFNCFSILYLPCELDSPEIPGWASYWFLLCCSPAEFEKPL